MNHLQNSHKGCQATKGKFVLIRIIDDFFQSLMNNSLYLTRFACFLKRLSIKPG